MTSLSSTEQTPMRDGANCDCGCVCCGPTDVNGTSGTTAPEQTDEAADASRCGCGCSD